jgi:hypothetical protein
MLCSQKHIHVIGMFHMNNQNRIALVLHQQAHLFTYGLHFLLNDNVTNATMLAMEHAHVVGLVLEREWNP